MFRGTRSPTSHRLGHRSTRPLVVAALCAAFLSATPATARAQTFEDADTVGDMMTLNDNDAPVPAPERTLNDVSNTTLTHGFRRVAIEVDYVDLKKKAGGQYQVLGIFMRTSEGVPRFVSLDAWQGHWSGETSMYGAQYRRTVTCSVRHAIDYDANVIKVSFPRGCASNPRWVRFRVFAYSQGDDGYFADDALSDNPIDSQDDQDLARSGRVHREDAN